MSRISGCVQVPNIGRGYNHGWTKNIYKWIASSTCNIMLNWTCFWSYQSRSQLFSKVVTVCRTSCVLGLSLARIKYFELRDLLGERYISKICSASVNENSENNSFPKNLSHRCDALGFQMSNASKTTTLTTSRRLFSEPVESNVTGKVDHASATPECFGGC